MSKLKLAFIVAAVATILIAVGSSRASAQICADCEPGEGFCATYPGDHHQDYETDGESGNAYDAEQAWHWTCYAGDGGTCAMHGNECVGHGRLLVRLEEALKIGDVSNVVSVLASSDRFFVNWERRAIQVKSCRGETVVRHIPLSQAVYGGLAMHLVLRADRRQATPSRYAALTR